VAAHPSEIYALAGLLCMTIALDSTAEPSADEGEHHAD
jgi:hypothetical protein